MYVHAGQFLMGQLLMNGVLNLTVFLTFCLNKPKPVWQHEIEVKCMLRHTIASCIYTKWTLNGWKLQSVMFFSFKVCYSETKQLDTNAADKQL